MNKYTDFLYARPSFLEGFARILDVGNTLNEYNCSMTDEQADRLAIWSDWRAVGSDIRRAAATVRSKMRHSGSLHGKKELTNRKAKRLSRAAAR